jgi:Zn finger protein HypA/HybF involved in hydrogenase expression
MPKRIFDFRCQGNHTTELFIDVETTSIECPECKEEARRIISPVSCNLDAVSGDFPGATMKWARDHEKAAKRN